MPQPQSRLQLITYPGLGNLTGHRTTPADIATTVGPLDRDQVVRVAIRILNSLASDRHLHDDQSALVALLEPQLQVAYANFLAANQDAIIRPFHPAQQLVLLHAVCRFSKGTPGSLPLQITQQRFLRAALQINDLLIKQEPDTRKSTVLYLLAELGPQWDLINNSQPLHSLGRLRFLLFDMAERHDKYGEAARALRARFPQYLGLPFDTVFHLTAFLIFWWNLHAQNVGTNPDAGLIDRRTWLSQSSIAIQDLHTFLDRLCTSPDQLVQRFDEIGIGMSFHELTPFRQRPLFRIDDHGVGIICPQFVTEKGGVDLFWLLTNDTPGTKEAQLWTDDFGTLFEGYVHEILIGLGDSGVGGNYQHSVSWVARGASGGIDGLVASGGTLLVLETKGSFVSQAILSRGDESALREELLKKFVTGTPNRPKGLKQLARSIDWLLGERRNRRSVRGIDLHHIRWIIPVLVVADRSLRFPQLARWFYQEFQSVLHASWGQVGPLVLCSLEDLEAMEQQAVDGNGSIVSTILAYCRDSPKAERPIGAAIDWSRPHRRLRDRVDAWIHELQTRGILP